jgi:hypothetical protein
MNMRRGISSAGLTLERDAIWDLKHSVLRCNCILSKRSVGCHHGMKCRHSISNFKFMRLLHIFAKGVDNPGNIIAAVEGLVDGCDVAPICES